MTGPAAVTARAPRSRERYDVVIVGARCAGASTALLLARQGMRVLVVERAEPGTDVVSTHALMRPAVVQLHRWGLLDRLRAARTPAIRTTTFEYGTDRVTVAIKPGGGIDALYAPRRTVLDPILVDAARAAGAEIRHGISVTGLLRDRSGRVTGVEARERAGASVELRARLVVGADGLRSAVARAVGAPVQSTGHASAPVGYGYWSGVSAEGYEWCFAPGAGAGLIPTDGGEVCVFASGLDPRSATRTRGGAAAWYREVLGRAVPGAADRLGTARGPDRLRVFPGAPGRLRVPWGPGWALVGDAGFFRDPITAHGISDALRDAELLARAVTATWSGELDEADALAAYQAARDRIAVPCLELSDAIGSYRWTMDEVGALHRRFSGLLADELTLIDELHGSHDPLPSLSLTPS